MLLIRLNIDGNPIANKYCEGKVKRTLKRGSKDVKPLGRKLWELVNVLNAARPLWTVDKVGSVRAKSSVDISFAVGSGWDRGAFSDLVETTFIDPS